MEAKHTPGPWFARKWNNPRLADGFVTVITDSRGHGLVEFLQKGQNAKNDANARLIAASPTMGKKLADTVEWLDREIEAEPMTTDHKFVALMDRLQELRDDLAETLRKIKEA